jgi:hypothetical protein
MWRCAARKKALSPPPSPSLPGLGTHQFNRRLPLGHTSLILGPDQFRPLRTRAHDFAAAA